MTEHMSAKDLIERLLEVPPETPIVMARDAEGNRFSGLAETSDEKYREETPSYGEIMSPDHEEEDMEGTVSVIVLWPV